MILGSSLIQAHPPEVSIMIETVCTPVCSTYAGRAKMFLTAYVMYFDTTTGLLYLD